MRRLEEFVRSIVGDVKIPNHAWLGFKLGIIGWVVILLGGFFVYLGYGDIGFIMGEVGLAIFVIGMIWVSFAVWQSKR